MAIDTCKPVIHLCLSEAQAYTRYHLDINDLDHIIQEVAEGLLAGPFWILVQEAVKRVALEKFCISEEQKSEYLEDPNHCPFCRGDDIEAGDFEADGKSAWCIVGCSTCGSSWTDIYELSDVTPR